MKNLKLFLFISLITLGCSFAQNENELLQSKLDSIIEEANILFNYEKVAWNATDLMMTNHSLRQKYGGYIIYHNKDTLFATFINKNLKDRIALYTFTTDDLDKPLNTDLQSIPLSTREKKLLDVKIRMLEQLSDKKYKVGFPEGYSPNLVLLEKNSGYKLYILMGTTQSDIIPFGNDFLFESDLEGNILSWRKFHSRVIPAQTEMPGKGRIVSAVHSHLKTTPYITATDICTFRLYGPLFEMKEFMVLSSALDKYFKYNLESNSIEVTDLD